MARKSRKQNRIRNSVKIETTTKEKTKTVLYARLSRSDIDTGKESMVNQLAMLRSFAEEYEDLEVVDEFVDDGYTGMNFDRPAYEEMMAGVRSGKYQCIIVKDLSRIGRSYLETSDLLEYELPLWRCRFISINDNIDTDSSPVDTIQEKKKNIMNQKFAEDISKKIKSSFKPRIEKGEFLGGPVPYGYRRDPENRGKLLIDEEAARVVVKVFHMKLGMMNDRQIASALNEEGIMTPFEYHKWKKTGVKEKCGRVWEPAAIRAMTQNPVYLGHVVHGKIKEKQYLGEKDRSTKRKDWVIYENINPPIISQEIFDQVLEIRPKLRGRRKKA